MQQVGTDHDSGPALARLAVDGSHVVVILAQPLVQVLTEGLYELQLGGGCGPRTGTGPLKAGGEGGREAGEAGLFVQCISLHKADDST